MSQSEPQEVELTLTDDEGTVTETYESDGGRSYIEEEQAPSTNQEMTNGGDETHQLEKLGVTLMEQTSLEHKLQTETNKILAQHELETDRKRLQKSQQKLNKIKYDLRKLKDKLASPLIKISEKERMRKQVEEIHNAELKETEEDIRDITSRINQNLEAGSSEQTGNLNETSSTERLPNESEKEFLIRTGKITAFGNETGFVVESGSGDAEDERDNQVVSHQNLRVPGFTNKAKPNSKAKSLASRKEPKVEDGDFIVDGDYEDEDEPQESEYEDEELEEDFEQIGVKKFKLLTEDDIRNVDDGDSKFFQSRLRTWCHHRSKQRPATGNNFEDAPEWLRPHPSNPDAALNTSFKIPGDIYPSLFDYQKTGIQWLYELYSQSHGGIISDEMGLGKTIQIVSFVAGLHYTGLLETGKPVLIVCPATVMTQWVNEFHSWWGALRVMVLHSIGSGMSNKRKKSEADLEDNFNDLLMSENEDDGVDRFKKLRADNVKSIIDVLLNEGHVLITSYVGLRIYEDYLLDINWGYVVLDEGHKIKNPNSNITILAKRLKTPNRVILSGTPIQNNLLELWSLFDFVYPGRLGTLPVFIEEFETPIKVGGYANASNLQVKTGYQKAVILKDLIQPFLLRRMKVDVARDLPSKSEYVLMCRLTKYQKDKYIEFLRSIEFKATNYLGSIMTLRKICNHPDLVDMRLTKNSPGYGDPSRSGKLQVLRNLLKLWKEQGQKVLLFTQTKQMMVILESFLISEYGPDYRFMKMSGETPISKRQDMIHTFNNEPFDLFLLTTKVGGLGVNLTSANRVIIFDPDWNPSTDLQARERAWRLGQKREVLIYRLIIGGSLEEKIYHRQIFKQLLTDKVLKDPNQKRFFKNEELRDLFTLSDFDEDRQDDLLSGGNNANGKFNDKKDDDLDKLKEIQGLQKMEKYKASGHTKVKESDSLMSGLFKSQVKVTKHDDIYESHTKPKDTYEDHLEREAKAAAGKALEALKKSRRSVKKAGGVGIPTFTGKFGVAGRIGKSLRNAKSKDSSPSSSSSILSNLKQKAAKSLTPSPSPTPSSISSDPNSEMLSKFVAYLAKQPDLFGRSKQILEGCGVALKTNNDLSLVRSLLKGVCTWDQEKAGWVLKEEFRA